MKKTEGENEEGLSKKEFLRQVHSVFIHSYLIVLTFVLIFVVFVVANIYRGRQMCGPEMNKSINDASQARGPAMDNIEFKMVKEEDAKVALLNGEIDIYAGSLLGEDIKELKDNSEVTLFPSASTMLGFYVNPYPDSADKLNPFSIKQVRYAMQFLVDREEMANELFFGFAQPTLTVPWSKHPDYQNIKSSVDESGISYDKGKATSLIKTGMEDAGATLESGKWMYGNKQVDIIISFSDSKQLKFTEMADMLKASLEEEGFAVTLLSTDYSDSYARPPENYTDAAELKWNIAISGWTYYGQTPISNVAILDPYVGDGWWEYSDKEIDELEEKQKNYKTEEERRDINNKLSGKYLEDSTGVWLLATDSVSAARKEVEGLIQDEFIGIKNYTNLRESYIPGKDKLIVGLPKFYDSSSNWNPWVVDGINAMYLLNTVHDPLVWNDTDTLEERSFSWPFTIENRGAEATIDIPDDTFFWNVKDKQWQEVTKDAKAVTKVTYDLSDYIGRKWHNGQEITSADIVYNAARAWDVAFDEEKQKIDDEWRQSYYEPIIGLRLDGTTLEVYLDKWSSDEDDLLLIAKSFQRMAPWELYAATDELVFDERLYDYQIVENSENEKLNLADPKHIEAIFETLDTFDFSKVSPMLTLGNKLYAQKSDLDSRISSLKHWYAYHNHLFVSDGAFYVDSIDTSDGSVEMKAFRDDSYPFGKGYWRN
ncbi:MAG: ABC transporter substrate-binding protein [Candidatus Pacebacteria bacterium]|nr:ABC transporter substrate-binding protein [Candidatus Paceibacterota bacterium]